MRRIKIDNEFTLGPRYPALQLFPTERNLSNTSSRQGKVIQCKIRTQAIDCAPICDCSKDDRKTAVETTSDEMVMGAVLALWAFCLLVSQQCHSDLSLTALDAALKRCDKKSAFENRECQSQQRPKWMNSCQENPISYENERFIQAVLQWPFRCTGLNRLQEQNEGNIRCAWIGPDKGQPNGQMLIGPRHKSDWSTQSIRWHQLNTSFSLHYPNIMGEHNSRRSGLRQPVPEAHSPNNLVQWSLLK